MIHYVGAKFMAPATEQEDSQHLLEKFKNSQMGESLKMVENLNI